MFFDAKSGKNDGIKYCATCWAKDGQCTVCRARAGQLSSEAAVAPHFDTPMHRANAEKAKAKAASE